MSKRYAPDAMWAKVLFFICVLHLVFSSLWCCSSMFTCVVLSADQPVSHSGKLIFARILQFQSYQMVYFYLKIVYFGIFYTNLTKFSKLPEITAIDKTLYSSWWCCSSMFTCVVLSAGQPVSHSGKSKGFCQWQLFLKILKF